MSRRRQPRPRPAVWVDWTPALAALFDGPIVRLLVDDAEPPRQVRVHYGRQHRTLVANWRRPDGGIVKAKVKIVGDVVRDADAVVRFNLASRPS